MSVIDFESRKQIIADRGGQFRAGQISESVFRASLHGMGLRKDDISQAVLDNESVRSSDSEQLRYDESVQWLREFLADQKGQK